MVKIPPCISRLPPIESVRPVLPVKRNSRVAEFPVCVMTKLFFICVSAPAQFTLLELREFRIRLPNPPLEGVPGPVVEEFRIIKLLFV
jgi:hypothetical protein